MGKMNKKDKGASKEDSRTCNICRKKFKRPYNLTVHRRTLHANVKLVAICPLNGKMCADSYSTKTNLQVHLKKHHNGKKIIDNKVDGRNIIWVKRFQG